jgi:hypothetical protein
MKTPFAKTTVSVSVVGYRRTMKQRMLTWTLRVIGILWVINFWYQIVLSRNIWSSSSSSSSSAPAWTTTTTTSDPATTTTNVQWRWNRYSLDYWNASSVNKSSLLPVRRGRYKLLIAQYDSGSTAAYSASTTAIHNSTRRPKSVTTNNPHSLNTHYYGSLLETSMRINRAYSRYYGYDYVILSGLAFVTPRDVKRHRVGRTTKRGTDNVVVVVPTIPPSRATYNKIVVLEQALKYNTTYDAVLLLDADAMLYDFGRDVGELLPAHKMLVAHDVAYFQREKDDSLLSTTTNINIGVTLWNLRHALTASTIAAWRRESIRRLDHYFWTYRTDDQAVLQHVLRRHYHRQTVHRRRSFENVSSSDLENPVHAIPFEFDYKNGRMVKVRFGADPKGGHRLMSECPVYSRSGFLQTKSQHFIRSISRAWNVVGMVDTGKKSAATTLHNLTAASATRVQLMQSVAREICQHYAPVCHGL